MRIRLSGTVSPLAGIEKTMIMEALRKTNGVQVQAAALLGIKERSLWHRIKKHAIDAKAFKAVFVFSIEFRLFVDDENAESVPNASLKIISADDVLISPSEVRTSSDGSAVVSSNKL